MRTVTRRRTRLLAALVLPRRDARGPSHSLEEGPGLLGALVGPWGVASWWVSPNPRLAGAAPQELGGTSSEADLITLAAAGLAH